MFGLMLAALGWMAGRDSVVEQQQPGVPQGTPAQAGTSGVYLREEASIYWARGENTSVQDQAQAFLMLRKGGLTPREALDVLGNLPGGAHGTLPK